MVESKRLDQTSEAGSANKDSALILEWFYFSLLSIPTNPQSGW
jgi:hypothetical protein